MMKFSPTLEQHDERGGRGSVSVPGRISSSCESTAGQVLMLMSAKVESRSDHRILQFHEGMGYCPINEDKMLMILQKSLATWPSFIVY